MSCFCEAFWVKQLLQSQPITVLVNKSIYFGLLWWIPQLLPGIKLFKHLNRLSVNSRNLTHVRFIYLLKIQNLFFILSAEWNYTTSRILNEMSEFIILKCKIWSTNYICRQLAHIMKMWHLCLDESSKNHIQLCSFQYGAFIIHISFCHCLFDDYGCGVHIWQIKVCEMLRVPTQL